MCEDETVKWKFIMLIDLNQCLFTRIGYW